jgi:pimeloyl-ACP methyl ester carboxylesterase
MLLKSKLARMTSSFRPSEVIKFFPPPILFAVFLFAACSDHPRHESYGKHTLQKFASGAELDSVFAFDKTSGTVVYSNESGTQGLFSQNTRNSEPPKRLSTVGAWPKNPALSPGGRYISFFSTDQVTGAGESMLYLLDSATNKVSFIRATKGSNHVGRAVFTPDGKKLLYEYIHLDAKINKDEFRTVDVETLEDTSLFFGGATGSRAPVFSHDGRYIYFFSAGCIDRISTEGVSRERLGCLPAGGTLYPKDIGEPPVVSRDGTRILFTMHLEGCPRVGQLTTASGKVTMIDPGTCGLRPQFAGRNEELVTYINLPLDGNRVVKVLGENGGGARTLGFAEGITYSIAAEKEEIFAVTATPRMTRSLIRINVGSGSVSTVAKGEDVELEATLLGSLGTLEVTSFDGLVIPVRVFEPACRKSESGPTVLYIHGSPEGRDDVPPRLSREIGYLLGQGFRVVAPNYRGSTGHGDRLGGTWKREDQVRDLVATAAAITTRLRVPQSEIYVMGICYAAEYLLGDLVERIPRGLGGVIAWSGGMAPILRRTPDAPDMLLLLTARDGILEKMKSAASLVSEREWSKIVANKEMFVVNDSHMILSGSNRLIALNEVRKFIEHRSGVACEKESTEPEPGSP